MALFIYFHIVHVCSSKKKRKTQLLVRSRISWRPVPLRRSETLVTMETHLPGCAHGAERAAEVARNVGEDASPRASE